LTSLGDQFQELSVEELSVLRSNPVAEEKPSSDLGRRLEPTSLAQVSNDKRAPQKRTKWSNGQVPRILSGTDSRSNETDKCDRPKEQIIDIAHGQEKAITKFEGLDLNLSIDNMFLRNSRSQSNRTGNKGRVRLERITDQTIQGVQVVELEDIKFGKSITLDRTASHIPNELRFVL
jgi:hypothetical protein